MASERNLIDAQIATATKKLEVIESIYQVLAAEELVLAAEQRRADAETLVLTAKRELAAVKQSMVPFYVEKAEAKEALALAITQEIPVQEAIIRLGYDRIALKDFEEDANHQTRQAEEAVVMANFGVVRATAAVTIARTQSQRLLKEFSNTIQAEIMDKKRSLAEDGFDFKLSSGLSREAIGVNNEVAVTNHETANLSSELAAILQNMEDRAVDQAATVKDGAIRIGKTYLSKNFSRKIVEGFWVGPMGSAEIG